MVDKVLLPGATLGVLGGGQLGRMFCVAARTMGYRVIVLDPDPACGAGQIADVHIQAEYTDQAALESMASQCDAVTLEFENIPSHSVRKVADNTIMFPNATAVEVAQNRDVEKQFAQRAGLQPVPYYSINSDSDLPVAAETTGFPAILKSNTLGYDGKGQYPVDDMRALVKAFGASGKVDCVLEKRVDIVKEISVIVARNARAELTTFPVSENQHRSGILHMSIIPARVSEEVIQRATSFASSLAEALSYVGILTVEFFVAEDGRLYFNEMAPRPHNSGHYTEDACVTSQFEQQVRMLCGLVPGVTRLASPVVMVNLLGDLWPPQWLPVFTENNVKLHLYGKKEARRGRKMGHFNVLAKDAESALATAEKVFAAIDS